MIGRTISHYRITGRLGAGGMGVVWEAVDTKLDRQVALKFLAPHLTRDTEAKTRFVREAKAAATLNHPNIATVYEIDETDDGMFIAMELVAGRSLHDILREGPMPLARATDISTRIGRGLAAAHDRGILHRDIKPGNILVTAVDEVKIVDFGLAKLAGATRMTEVGTTLGTAAYMSPEQARGEEVTQQTDIWSLGAIHYEMLTGKRPFRGKNVPDLVHAIVHDEPVPATSLVGTIPATQDQVLAMALAKDTADRYATIEEFLNTLEDPDVSLADTVKLQTGRGRKRIRFDLPRALVLGAGFALLVVAAAGYYFISQRLDRDFQARDYLLVTEFEDLSDTGGLHRILRTALTIDIEQSRYVNVFAGKRLTDALARMEKPPGEPITPELGMDLAIREAIPVILTGSASRVGGQLMVAVQLLRPGTGEVLFATRVQTPDQEGLFPAVDELSEAVRKRLGEPLSRIRENDEPLAKVTTSSLAALQLFSDGNRSFLEADWNRAVSLLNQAVAVDTTFAMAYAKLARIYFYNAGTVDALEYSDRAYRWRMRLTLRERLYIEGEYFRYRAQYDDAITSMAALVALYPDDIETHTNLTNTYLFMLRYDDALQHLYRLGPGDQSTWYQFHSLGNTYGGLADFKAALKQFGLARVANPSRLRSQMCISWCHLCTGNGVAAAAAMDTLLNTPSSTAVSSQYMVAKCLPVLGRFRDTLALLETARDGARAQGLDSQVAWNYLFTGLSEERLGNRDRAIEVYAEACVLWPGSYPLVYLGRAHARAGDLEAAEDVAAQIARILEQEPTTDNRHALIKVQAAIAMERRNFTRAVELLVELLPTTMDNLDAHFELGRARFAAGDLEGARSSFEFMVANRYFTFHKGAPAMWPLAEYHLGLVAEADGRPRDARRHYEAFLGIWADADDGLAEDRDARRRLAALD